METTGASGQTVVGCVHIWGNHHLLVDIPFPGIFVAQSIAFWTAGIKLYMHLHVERGVAPPLAKLAVFVVGTITTGVGSEVIYRMIDMPSLWIAKETFSWLLR